MMNVTKCDRIEKKAVVLLSGGLDSATVMALAKSQGFEVYGLSFDYGQRHIHELTAAKQVCQALGAIQHRVFKIDLRQIGGSALTDDIAVPKTGKINAGEIPVTYVPARNTIFLSIALAWAEVLGCGDIFIGVNALDYSGYPDCRPEYIAAFEHMASLGLKAAVEKSISIKIRTPLIHMTKAQIIETGIKLGVDYAMTHSCYDPFPDGSACGCCDSCVLRKSGFEKARMPDPTRYIK
jgi:7-cyano-7-deazaguanine synthase